VYHKFMNKDMMLASTSISSSYAMPVLVLLLCFLFNLTGRGVSDTYLVFLLPLGSEFGWHRSQMTSVYSALMVVGGLASPLVGMVFERFGPRVLYGSGLILLGTGHFLAGQLQQLWQFYLCISVLGGLGVSAMGMVPASALISRWFHGRLSTATAPALCCRWCAWPSLPRHSGPLIPSIPRFRKTKENVMTDDTRLIGCGLTYQDMPVGFRFRTMRRTITA
jgi:MFS family permease